MELISDNAALVSLQDVAFLHTKCAMCVLQFPAEGTGLLFPSVIVWLCSCPWLLNACGLGLILPKPCLFLLNSSL